MKTRRLWIEVNNLFLKMLLVNSSFWEVLFEVLFCMINPVVVVKDKSRELFVELLSLLNLVI